ncbi:MAG: TetR/AcrR family transcriptional regulator [Candidatus Metalachnospira sp.]|jgi:AcrR family transcriptional regulator
MLQLTKKAIVNSFIKLLNEKLLDKITVKNIAEDCGINRNTFYYHFSDIRELTVYTIDSQIHSVSELDFNGDSWVDSFVEAAKFVIDNKKAVYNIYNSLNRETVENYLNTVAFKVTDNFVSAKAVGIDADKSDIELIKDFYMSALVGIICKWLENGMDKDPDIVIRRLGRLVEGAVITSLKISEEEKHNLGQTNKSV